MTERLSWEEIEKRFNLEWVELVNYDWPEEDPYPSAGVVRVHARTRPEFDVLAGIDAPEHSAYIFVGRPERADDVYRSTVNLSGVS